MCIKWAVNLNFWEKAHVHDAPHQGRACSLGPSQEKVETHVDQLFSVELPIPWLCFDLVQVDVNEVSVGKDSFVADENDIQSVQHTLVENLNHDLPHGQE